MGLCEPPRNCRRPQLLKEGAAVSSTADKIGCSAHTLLERVKKAEVNSGKRAAVPTELADRLRALERENCELRQDNEILWFNNRWLLAPIGNSPPAEAEEHYYAMPNDTPKVA